MITGSEAESRALMMNAAVRIVAQYGFEGFTTKKWALEAGVAEGSLYYHFKSKSDLLNETFFMIDQEITALYADDEVIPEDPEELSAFVETLWGRCYHYLLGNPEKALFYHRFRTSPRYTEEIQRMQLEEYGTKMKVVFELMQRLNVKSMSIEKLLCCFIMDTTTSFAYRVVTGGITHSAKTEKEVACFVLQGMRSLFNSERS